jgi:hypothetical protein
MARNPPKRVLRFALNVELGNSNINNEVWMMLTIRDSSTPSPMKHLRVTNVTKKDDILGNEFPSISNADSGVSMIMASVSKTDPAMEVTRNKFNTCQAKYRLKAFI